MNHGEGGDTMGGEGGGGVRLCWPKTGFSGFRLRLFGRRVGSWVWGSGVRGSVEGYF